MKKYTRASLPLHLRLGNSAETRAAKHLTRQGLTRIESNYRCKAGEIDLVMLENNILVFVEVRYRSNPFFGSAAESITRGKIQRLRKTAEYFLLTHRKYAYMQVRFDVIAITVQNQAEELVWIKDAF